MSKDRIISVLLVEDNLADACYIEEMLPSTLYNVRHVVSLESAYAFGFESTDIVLLDLCLPDGQGLQTCMSMVEHAPQTPIIILTGRDNEELGLDTLKLGAQDYILKREINENTLPRSIRWAIERKGWEKGVRASADLAKRSEAEAREVAANLKLALKASSTGIWSWDFVADKVTADEQAAALFGIEQCAFGDSVQMFFDRIHGDDRDAVTEKIRKAIEWKSEYYAEFRTDWPDGSIHYLVARGQVIEESHGSPFRLAGICRDVTKRHEEAERAKRLLMLEQHEDFTATLTHDLKNPLIGAEQLLQMLIEGEVGKLEQNQLTMLGVLRQSNSDMLALIQNLLEVYRFDGGAPEMKYTIVDISTLANSCVLQFTPIVQNAGVKLDLNFTQSDHTISADAIAMRRILTNLIGNAIKFTRSGGMVVVSGHRLGECYILEVEDTGTGIPQQELGLLFRRYSQTVLARRCGAGTGLGLYLCRQLVEALGGQINCTSEEGIGSTFKVILPVNLSRNKSLSQTQSGTFSKLDAVRRAV